MFKAISLRPWSIFRWNFVYFVPKFRKPLKPLALGIGLSQTVSEQAAQTTGVDMSLAISCSYLGTS